jgi:hypothetical protein
LLRGLCMDCGRPREASGSASYCSPCRTRRAAANNEHSRATRLSAVYHYSGQNPRCACCGEAGLAFLTLDHVNNDGAEHRRRHKGHQGTYRQLKADGYPPGIQVLCYNCNMARSAYGSCPHRWPVEPERESGGPTARPGRSTRSSPSASSPPDAASPLKVCRRCGETKPAERVLRQPPDPERPGVVVRRLRA